LDNTKVDVMANSSASQLQLLLTKDAAVNGSSDDKHGVVALNPELQVAKLETLKGHLANDPKYHNSNIQTSLQTEAKQYKCEICAKSFGLKEQLEIHCKEHIHSNERPHICLVCKKAFIYKGSLKAHMRMHTGEKPYSCSQCGRSFKHKCHLNDHVRSHSGIKQFVCSICGRACARQTQLKAHMRTHNGEKPYQCDICKRSFSHRGTLKSHVKIHEAKKKDSCGLQAGDRPAEETAGAPALCLWVFRTFFTKLHIYTH
uniref:C2H2-type domain-containing protein n=1 Tax=Neolamprologus brichardi TaxID=32507 RepID=A0A3Q4IC28_NEOBR